MAETESGKTDLGFNRPVTTGSGNGQSEGGATQQFTTAKQPIGIPRLSPLDIGATIEAKEPEPGEFKRESGESGIGGRTDEPRNDQPRRRGRPPGSVNRPRGEGFGTEKSTTPRVSLTDSALGNIEAMLFSTHLMLSKIASVPELELDQTESKRMADAIREVAKHYPIPVSDKSLALVNLCTTMGGIYAPRAVAIYKRSGRKPATILPMPRAANGPNVQQNPPPGIPKVANIPPQQNHTPYVPTPPKTQPGQEPNPLHAPIVLRDGMSLQGLSPSQLNPEFVNLNDNPYPSD